MDLFLLPSFNILSNGLMMLLALALMLITIIEFKRRINKSIFAGIPSPKGHFFFGNALQLPSDPFKFSQVLDQWHDEYNAPLMVLWIFHIPMVIMMRHFTADKFLKNAIHSNKPGLYQIIKDWLKDGLVMSTGTKWQKRRKLLTPAFHSGILRNAVSSLTEHASELVKKIKSDSLSKGCTEYEVQSLMNCAALDIICDVAMGVKLGALEENVEAVKYVKAGKTQLQHIQYRAFRPLFWSTFVYNLTPMGRESVSSLKILHDFTKDVIIKRIKTINQKGIKESKNTFLDILLRSTDEEGRQLSFNDIQEEVDTFMVAGHDSTATGVSFSLHLLANFPEIQTKVREEITSQWFENEPLTNEHLANFKYLEAVCKETLRLFPPAYLFGRTCGEDTDVQGHVIPKGTLIIISPFFIHRDPDIYPNPEEFDPSRFYCNNDGKPYYSYVPFAAGPRNCIGQKFAMTEMKVVLAFLVRNFHLSSSVLCDRIERKVCSEITLKALNGLPVKFTPITQDGE